MSESDKNFKSKAKTAGKESFLFLKSPIFLKNFAGMVGMVLGILLLTFWWMTCYTHHGESLLVPNYLDKSVEEAKKLAAEQNLKLVINDSVWMADRPAGSVLEQSPKPLSKVKEKRTIYLTITKFKAEEKLLPTLAGNDNYNYYARKLKKLKVNLKIRDKQFSNKLEENTILFLYVDDKKVTLNDLKKGVKVPQGAMVEAVVTTRGGGRVSIPNLMCKKYNEAEFLVEGSQLTISVIKDGTVKSLDNAYVWKQTPAYSSGATLGVGATINVYLTRQPPASCN